MISNSASNKNNPKRETAQYKQAYVWIWLPGATKPIVAGKLEADGDKLLFNYGKSYLDNNAAISVYDPELPLKAGALPAVYVQNPGIHRLLSAISHLRLFPRL